MLNPILLQLLGKFLKGAAPEAVRKKMEKGLPKVVDRMVREGVTLEEGKPPFEVGRFALYWLWKSVIPSGPVADLFRDRQEEAVVRRAMASIAPGTPTQAFVQRIMQECIEQTF